MIRCYDESQFDFEAVARFETKVSVVDGTTLDAARELPDPCCLIFASAEQPGGGYEAVLDLPMPIKTQEEDIYRRSTLPSLMDTEVVRRFYPLKGLASFYCSKATVDKDAYLRRCEPFDISTITMPAVINPQGEELNLVLSKIERILEIACHNNKRNLVLGAWGCGVFGNEPGFIAAAFKSYLDSDFRGVFENVVFAIPGVNSHNHQKFVEALNVPSLY